MRVLWIAYFTFLLCAIDWPWWGCLFLIGLYWHTRDVRRDIANRNAEIVREIARRDIEDRETRRRGLSERYRAISSGPSAH